MVGNVYVKFSDEEEAESAPLKLNGLLLAIFSSVGDCPFVLQNEITFPFYKNWSADHKRWKNNNMYILDSLFMKSLFIIIIAIPLVVVPSSTHRSRVSLVYCGLLLLVRLPIVVQ